ncbi:MAG: AMP-binding protein [Betaproteobacteria bacterium]
MAAVPFLSHRGPDEVVAFRGRRTVRVAEFLADVRRVAASLLGRPHLVNFCNDRYRFAVGLCAALVRGQVSLLPPTQTPEMLAQLQQAYPGLYALTDAPQAAHGIEQVLYCDSDGTAAAPGPVPELAPEQVAVIAFTSGSTGRSTPHPKTWGAIARGAAGEAQQLGLGRSDRSRGTTGKSATVLVGTVPPQHMYGLESTVLMALRNGLVLHAARPFYPADVRAALEDIPGGRVLVTTPVHLRALLADRVELPALELIVCATAPLSADLASLAEARFGAPLHEVYGFTEAGMVATRRTVDGPQWHTLPGVRLREQGDTVHVHGGHVQDEVAFSDVVEVRDAQTFILCGRNADLVNVAGKRTSLAYLNHHLNSIEGVEDGVFFVPDETEASVTRLTAFVVAPALSRQALIEALRLRIDPVYLPRPLYCVESLPRNATGKLPREALLRFAADCARRKASGGRTGDPA